MASTRVFVSYSRKDRAFVMRLSDRLEGRGVDVMRDLDDIAPTEEWWPRIKELITAADAVVYVITPDSVGSEMCARELRLCAELNKRLAPIVQRDTPGFTVPEQLSKLNYVFFTDPAEFDRSLSALVGGLTTDLVWVREHTRLYELARRWRARGGALLMGDELAEAERWTARQPETAPAPTDLHRAYIAAGREAANARARSAGDMKLAQDYTEQGNLAGAMEAWKRAAALGNADAMTHLGDAYFYGRGVSQDQAIALHWYEQAAAGGDLHAMVALAAMYELGDGATADPAKAAVLYRQAAERRNPMGMAKYGQLLLRGFGVARDEDQGLRWISEAAALKFPLAMTELADVLLHHERLGGDRARGIALLREAAAANEPKALMMLAEVYLEGQFAPRDAPQGARLMRQAAELGWIAAAYKLGELRLAGDLVEYDHAEGIRWLVRAAQAGHAGARARLANPPAPKPQIEGPRTAKDYLRCPECSTMVRKSDAELGMTPGSTMHGAIVVCPNCRFEFDRGAVQRGAYDADREQKSGGCAPLLLFAVLLAGGLSLVVFNV